MKVKIKDIKQNPFKKFVNRGKLDKNRVAKMLESVEHGTLPNSFFARKVNGKWELAHGHHRLAAFEKKHGKNFELNVNPVKYDDETMLVDMVRENLTHRDSDFRDVEDSCVLTRKWLESKASTVKQFDSRVKWKEGKRGNKALDGSEPLPDSCRSIAKFLSKQGKAICYETVRSHLQIHDNLVPDLHKKVGKLGRDGPSKSEDSLGLRIALKLSSVPKNEQKEVFNSIQKTDLNSKGVTKAITAYKEVDDLTKKRVRKGSIKLSDLPEVIKSRELEARIFDQSELPEPDTITKANELQQSFNRRQENWLKTLALFTKHTITTYKYTKTEIKAFIKDIQDTKEREREVIKMLEDLL